MQAGTTQAGTTAPEIPARVEEAAFAPVMSRTRGRQLLAYANSVYGVGDEMAKIADARKNPDIPLALINSTLFVSGLLRVRSLNALEAELEKAWFAHAVGAEAAKVGSAPCATWPSTGGSRSGLTDATAHTASSER